VQPAEGIIFGKSEMADLIRAHDWSATPLGPLEGWSETLIATVNLMLWPNRFAQNLTEGILRASFRASTTGEPTPITPGKVYEYKIDLWSTSNVFLKGHRLRLEVSSSNFPRFDRNLNTGKSGAQDAHFVKATNTILLGGEHSSALILPVVPGNE
jgi:putative CocE/NonD family hydrolase